MSTTARRRPLTALSLLVLALGPLTGCALFPDPVTDCEQSSPSATCQRDQRFELAGTSIVVDELENFTETGDGGGDQARVEAQLTIDGEPANTLQVQLHVIEPLTEETSVFEPDASPAAGEQTLTFDFSGRGYARRIQTDTFPPSIVIVFDDGERTVTVTVMHVEYSQEEER